MPQKKAGLTTQDLILIAVLLAAGAVLKLTVGSLLSSMGMKPNFIIAMYCLAIILTKPKIGQALIIGLFQVLSVIPGTSRSGATILGALVLGVARPVAAEFTFFLAIPTMFGASLLKTVKFIAGGAAISGAEMAMLATGCLVAFAVSLFAIGFLMRYVKKHDFKVFGWYRIALGIVVTAYFLLLAK